MGGNNLSGLERPTQAVILAGGRGTRLAPLTDNQPKPMISFHGKPFLEYLIEMLRDQGFDRVLLLLGYLADVVRDYFGDGERWGIQVEYSISPVQDATGRRIKLAESSLDPCFLLMYCDNYWPMRMDDMWERFLRADGAAMITAYGNKDQYSKDNIVVDEDGFVGVYDKTRSRPGLQGVEIGYALMTKSVIGLLPDENVSFEKVVYPRLVQEHRLQAYLTDHRYYSVGSHERLPLTEEFLARHPAVILDRDGVLNKKPARAEYVRDWSEFEWLPGAKEALRLFNKADYQVIIVSNQAGIARGAMSDEDLGRIHERMKADVVESGGRIDAMYYCPHGWDEACECRKPKPGMLFQAQRDFNLDLSRTYFVGDDERDGQAARAAGCREALVSNGTSLLDVARLVIEEDF